MDDLHCADDGIACPARRCCLATCLLLRRPRPAREFLMTHAVHHLFTDADDYWFLVGWKDPTGYWSYWTYYANIANGLGKKILQIHFYQVYMTTRGPSYRSSFNYGSFCFIVIIRLLIVQLPITKR